MFNFDKKIFGIFGLNNSGKTNLAKTIVKPHKAIVFDVLGEYDQKIFDVYVPKAKDFPHIAYENDRFIQWLTNPQTQVWKKYDMIYYSEASRIFPNLKPLFPAMRSYLDTYRHYGHSLGYDCRRPVQLNTDLVELSHYIFSFNLKGLNDTQYFNKLNSQIGDTLFKLPQYNFLCINEDRTFNTYAPVPKA